MDKEFRNQIGIITGAASGLGSAIAIKLSEKGVKVVLFDRDESGLERTKSLLSTDCETYVVDITDEKEVAKWIGKVGERFGKIDILVNSAGITGETNISSHEVNSDDLRQVFEVNFMGSYYTSKYVLPWMLKNNYGRI